MKKVWDCPIVGSLDVEYTMNGSDSGHEEKAPISSLGYINRRDAVNAGHTTKKLETEEIIFTCGS